MVISIKILVILFKKWSQIKTYGFKGSWKNIKIILIKNKSILVFHNIKDKCQIADVVSFNDIFASNGSTLIATTWDSIKIKHFGEES